MSSVKLSRGQIFKVRGDPPNKYHMFLRDRGGLYADAFHLEYNVETEEFDFIKIVERIDRKLIEEVKDLPESETDFKEIYKIE